MPNRDFNFPISTLLRDSKRLAGALKDSVFGAPVTRRLPTSFVADYNSQIELVETGGGAQSTAAGVVGQLTAEQTTAFLEMERLLSGARRSATLTFPRGDVRLHAEFQIGEHDRQDLASELERAHKTLTACQTHAALLTEHGWLAEDTTALAQAISTLSGADDDQNNATDKKSGITALRNRNANKLYKQCQSIQNAARLAFPSTKPGNEEARARYLLDDFPPRGGASAGDQPQPTPTPTPTPPKT